MEISVRIVYPAGGTTKLYNHCIRISIKVCEFSKRATDIAIRLRIFNFLVSTDIRPIPLECFIAGYINLREFSSEKRCVVALRRYLE